MIKGTEARLPDLRRRVERLLAGDRRIDDLQRVYLDLRERAHGRASVTEVGDFVAHRNERVKGAVTRVVRDLLGSFRFWASGLLGAPMPDLKSEQFQEIARANLRLATNEQIREGCGLRREVARSVLEQSLKGIEKGRSLTERETNVLAYFGNRFIWNPAFTDVQLFDDLVYVLIKNGVLCAEEVEPFATIRTFNTLFAITMMHNSTVLLPPDDKVQLFAGCANRQGQLEIKAILQMTDSPKPIIAPVCIFWTELDAKTYCSPTLLSKHQDWLGPIDIVDGTKLDVL